MELFDLKKENAVQAKVTPEELLYQRFSRPRWGDTFADAVRSTVWKLLLVHAPDFMRDKKFEYGDVTVVNGVFVVTFFNRRPDLPSEPGGP